MYKVADVMISGLGGMRKLFSGKGDGCVVV